MREGDNVVDAGREQHHQHAQAQQRVRRQELHQDHDEQWNHDEVRNQQRDEKAKLRERALEFGSGTCRNVTNSISADAGLIADWNAAVPGTSAANPAAAATAQK